VKRLLLVTYYFPPLGGSGVFRPLRLAKYLPRHGWDVTVLTVRDRPRALRDPSLAAEVPAGVRVERTAALEPRTCLIALNRLGLRALVGRLEPWLMLPDEQRGWVPFATRRGVRLLREQPHHAMLSTAGPYSAHLVARAIKRRCPTPWVADFRDEWTTNPYLRDRYPTSWHRRWNRRLERAVLHEADRVTCVSRPWLDAIHAVASDLPGTKFAVHPNGFDGEHFEAGSGRRPARFRIVYTGTFYGHRSPETFLEGARLALASGRIPREEIEIVFMGHGPAGAGDDPALAGVLRAIPHRPYFESLDLLQEAALLLLVVPPEGGVGNHTGKLFPYLASGRPILALAPQGNVAGELVRASRSGIVAPPDDPHAIAQALESCHRAWKLGEGLPRPDRARIIRYEASHQAADWANFLDATLESCAGHAGR